MCASLHVCFLSWQWWDGDTPLTPGWHVAADYFTARGVTEGWLCVRGCCLSCSDHRVHRWSTATRSFQRQPTGEKSLYCRIKRNINGLEDRCVLCWEIYFPLHGVFTLAKPFDWYYGGRFSLLLDCQYCSVAAKFDKLLQRRFAGRPAEQMDGGGSCNLNLIFRY